MSSVVRAPYLLMRSFVLFLFFKGSLYYSLSKPIQPLYCYEIVVCFFFFFFFIFLLQTCACSFISLFDSFFFSLFTKHINKMVIEDLSEPPKLSAAFFRWTVYVRDDGFAAVLHDISLREGSPSYRRCPRIRAEKRIRSISSRSNRIVLDGNRRFSNDSRSIRQRRT
jgi:hypothetical protein